MHEGKELLVYEFVSSQNPLNQFSTDQSHYLRCYLQGLFAKVVIEEQNYFDRDYLAEFSAFYSLSSRGYPNICRRLHFFCSDKIDKGILLEALGGDFGAIGKLRSAYLGFIVIRPITVAPFGRTVLKWFNDREQINKRVISPSRVYRSSLAGIELNVTGLAWQQQDSGVSACATIGLWTMLHSSAFDAHHAIPTTADITQSAHNTASLGSRVFPSKSLKIEQILEAIKEHKLAPVLNTGDVLANGGTYYSKRRLASTLSAFIRSGYPVLLIGRYVHKPQIMNHMVCAVGFRENATCPPVPGKFSLMDENATIIYVHDDNIGPSVRCELQDEVGFVPNAPNQAVAILTTCPPVYAGTGQQSPISAYKFMPQAIIVGAHEELRISSDDFYVEGMNKTNTLCLILNNAYLNAKITPPSLLFSTRFLRLRDYLGEELNRHFTGNSAVLSKVRIALAEKVPPMSLHIGLLRIALNDTDSTLLMDILYDTSDSDRNRPIFAHLIYDENLQTLLAGYPPEEIQKHFGMQIEAF